MAYLKRQAKTTMRAELISMRLRSALTYSNNPLVLMVLSVLLTVALRLVSDFGYVWWIRPIGTLFVFLVGVALYLFRKHYQRVFGVSEVLFALTVSWISIARAQILQDGASRIAVVAAAYLIVRGLSNYEEGRKKRVAQNEF
jgi:hypothetical protein